MQQKRSEINLPKISIIIPSYNKEKFIGSTLESIFNQSYPNLEVIVQDGGSTDGTVEIIKKYAKMFPGELSYVSKKDNGQLDAILKGLKKANGDLITFINADDEYTQNSLFTFSQKFIEHPKALLFAGKGIVINEKGDEIAKPVTMYKNFLFGFNKYSMLLTTNYLIQPGVFINHQAYKKYGPFTGTTNFVMEYDLWLKLGKVKMPVLINQTVTRFRIEPTTKTKRLFNDLLLEDQKIVKKYTNNKLILFIHWLNNIGRVLVGRFV